MSLGWLQGYSEVNILGEMLQLPSRMPLSSGVVNLGLKEHSIGQSILHVTTGSSGDFSFGVG